MAIVRLIDTSASYCTVMASKEKRNGELLTGLISCECGVEKGREQLLQPSAEHIQHLHSHTESRSIDLTTHTRTGCAQ